jgi:hypothetical protein
MTKDDIIRMALEAGIEYSNLNQMASPYCDGVHMDELEIFFKKAFEAGSVAEREACAKFIEDEYVRQFEEPWRQNLAKAIRAMGAV